MQVSSYSAQNVVITWLGHSFVGLDEGDDSIQVTRDNPTMSKTVGIQGDVVFTQSTDKSGTITIRTLQNSETNSFLSAKAQASEAGVVANGPLIIDEIFSDAKVVCNKTVIQGVPGLARGAGHNSVEWVFLAAEVLPIHGMGAEIN